MSTIYVFWNDPISVGCYHTTWHIKSLYNLITIRYLLPYWYSVVH
jgi:hypothetical protein